MSKELRLLVDMIKDAFRLEDRDVIAALPFPDSSGVSVMFRRGKKLFKVDLKLVSEEL